MRPDEPNNTGPGRDGRPVGVPSQAEERAHELLVERAVNGLGADEAAELRGLLDGLGLADDASSLSALDATVATVELAYGERVALSAAQRLRLEAAAAAWAARAQSAASAESVDAGSAQADVEQSEATRERVLLLGEVYGQGPAPVVVGARRGRLGLVLGGVGWAAAACLGVALIIVNDRRGAGVPEAGLNDLASALGSAGPGAQRASDGVAPASPGQALAVAVPSSRAGVVPGPGAGGVGGARSSVGAQGLVSTALKDTALDDSALAFGGAGEDGLGGAGVGGGGYGLAEADPLWAESPRPVYASAASLVTLVQAEPDRVLVPMHRPGEEAAPPVAYVIWSGDLQAGVLVVAALEPIDPPIDQYQLWIVDPTRESQYPVSGAVFSMPEQEASALVRVRPEVTVARPSAFVLTIERAGGVVVSRGESVVAVGSTEPLGIARAIATASEGPGAVVYGPPEPESARPGSGAGGEGATR